MEIIANSQTAFGVLVEELGVLGIWEKIQLKPQPR